jgi:hypothetical protein
MTWANALFFAAMTASCFAQDPSTTKKVVAVYPEAYALYLDLHQNPELSSHETRTAAKLASQLRALGYDVTEHVGGTGIVAILKNGSGPTVMHSSLFAPDVDPALHTGIAAEVAVLRDLLNASTNDLYKLTHQQSNSSQ